MSGEEGTKENVVKNTSVMTDVFRQTQEDFCDDSRYIVSSPVCWGFYCVWDVIEEL